MKHCEPRHPIVTWQLLSTLLWQWLPALAALTAAAAAAYLAKEKIDRRKEFGGNHLS